VSLLTDGSGEHDVQLAYYAKVIEQDDEKNIYESSGDSDLHSSYIEENER